MMSFICNFDVIRDSYPPEIGLEQMRCICHISKKTARYLLKSGLVPNIDTGKKTRQYIIKTEDVIRYLSERERDFQKYKPPEGYYASNWYYTKRRRQPRSLKANYQLTEKDRKPLARFLTKKFAEAPDVLTAAEISTLTGYGKSGINAWCRKGAVKAFDIKGRYMFPKKYLIEYLVSDDIWSSGRPPKQLRCLVKEYAHKTNNKAISQK